MLKIKDNIDLEELKKYGFEYNKNMHEYEIGYIFNGYISIEKNDRLIKPIYDENMWINIEDLLYDLIKADLVDKVEENKNESNRFIK